ncbi:MAG: SH3 domain-containing protein, partial [Chloroflexota bacterium]
MIRKILSITLAGIFLFTSLTGCLPGRKSEGTSTVVIVEPVEAAQFQVGDLVKVLSLLSSDAGAAKVDLLVNGKSTRSDVLNPQIKNGNMLQSWIPMEAGVYTLQVRTSTSSGQTLDSAPVSVKVIDRLPPSPTVVPDTETPSPTPFDTLTPTITLTPQLTISQTTVSGGMNIIPSVTSIDSTSCRTGPSSVYPVVGILGSGEEAIIIGPNDGETWWYVQQTNGVDCWVWDGVVTVNGETGGMLIIDAPPTPDPTPTVIVITAPNPVGPSGQLSC